jgi:hypothetical protein
VRQPVRCWGTVVGSSAMLTRLQSLYLNCTLVSCYCTRVHVISTIP